MICKQVRKPAEFGSINCPTHPGQNCWFLFLQKSITFLIPRSIKTLTNSNKQNGQAIKSVLAGVEVIELLVMVLRRFLVGLLKLQPCSKYICFDRNSGSTCESGSFSLKGGKHIFE